MNVAYNEISCADAAKMIGVDYSTVVKWCKGNRINCVNVSGGIDNGRYILTENEVEYIKYLKEKFGKQFIRKYRKDWSKGHQPAQQSPVIEEKVEEVKKPVAAIKSVVVNMTKEEPTKSDRIDIDEIAIKIGYIQDIKDKLEALELSKQKLTDELEQLRKEVMEYL